MLSKKEDEQLKKTIDIGFSIRENENNKYNIALRFDDFTMSSGFTKLFDYIFGKIKLFFAEERIKVNEDMEILYEGNVNNDSLTFIRNYINKFNRSWDLIKF